MSDACQKLKLSNNFFNFFQNHQFQNASNREHQKRLGWPEFLTLGGAKSAVEERLEDLENWKKNQHPTDWKYLCFVWIRKKARFLRESFEREVREYEE